MQTIFFNSYFTKATMRVFDKIDNGKAGVLPSSKPADLIEIIEDSFYCEELAVHMWILYPNESGSLYCFAFVRWYVDKEIYIDSAEEAERLVG